MLVGKLLVLYVTLHFFKYMYISAHKKLNTWPLPGSGVGL